MQSPSEGIRHTSNLKLVDIVAVITYHAAQAKSIGLYNTDQRKFTGLSQAKQCPEHMSFRLPTDLGPEHSSSVSFPQAARFEHNSLISNILYPESAVLKKMAKCYFLSSEKTVSQLPSIFSTAHSTETVEWPIMALAKRLPPFARPENMLAISTTR